MPAPPRPRSGRALRFTGQPLAAMARSSWSWRARGQDEEAEHAVSLPSHRPGRQATTLWRSAGDELLGTLEVALVLFLGRREQVTPGSDVGPTPEQCAALPFGHAAPDPELDPVIEGVGKALGTDRASPADQLRPVLGRSLHEQRIGVRISAGR